MLALKVDQALYLTFGHKPSNLTRNLMFTSTVGIFMKPGLECYDAFRYVSELTAISGKTVYLAAEGMS